MNGVQENILKSPTTFTYNAEGPNGVQRKL